VWKVLENVKRRDHVEARRGERRIHGIADEDLGADRARLRRRGGVDLDPRHAPAHCGHQAQKLARGATDIEQASLTDPRRKMFDDATHQAAGAEPNRDTRIRCVEMAVAEPRGERPAHRRPGVPQETRKLGVAGVAGIVVRVGEVELLDADTRVLLPQSAGVAPGQGETAGNTEGDVAEPGSWRHRRGPAEWTGDRLEIQRPHHRPDSIIGSIARDRARYAA
jgi:hypothetical protein